MQETFAAMRTCDQVKLSEHMKAEVVPAQALVQTGDGGNQASEALSLRRDAA